MLQQGATTLERRIGNIHPILRIRSIILRIIRIDFRKIVYMPALVIGDSPSLCLKPRRKLANAVEMLHTCHNLGMMKHAKVHIVT